MSQSKLPITFISFKTNNEQVEHIYKDSDSSDDDVTVRPPEQVPSDMENGLESVSCQLASEFYNRYGTSLHGITKRGGLSQLYIDTYDSWCPAKLKGQPRHFKQVLYALANDTKKVRVVGGGRFLRWTEFQHRGRHNNSSDNSSGSHDQGVSQNNSNRQNQETNGRQPITEDLLDRIAERLAGRDNN